MHAYLEEKFGLLHLVGKDVFNADRVDRNGVGIEDEPSGVLI